MRTYAIIATANSSNPSVTNPKYRLGNEVLLLVCFVWIVGFAKFVGWYHSKK